MLNMRHINHILLCVLLLVSSSVQAGPHDDAIGGIHYDSTGMVGTHSPTIPLSLYDDVPISWGDDQDASIEWDTDAATHNVRLTMADSDGAGTPGDVWYVNEGTDDMVFNGNLSVPSNIYSGETQSDATANELAILGGNAYPQAAVNTMGGDLVLAGGIGTNKITCDDRTIADQDVLTFTVNGSGTTLTESTDFDCEGEASEEACCDNLGTAITTAAIGITPDCATTAGTCYLSFDHTVRTFDMAIADGAADGAFGSLTEGADGAAYAPDGLTFGYGNTGKIRHDAANARTEITAQGNNVRWYVSLNKVATLTNTPLGWLSSTSLDDNGADGTLMISNHAQTQGVTLKTTDAADTLSLYDLAGTGAGTFVTGNSTITGNYVAGTRLITSGEVNAPGGSTSIAFRPVESYSSAINSGSVTIQSPNQTNTGNYTSGDVTILSGATTTDGDTGDVVIYSGTAGAGAADAGDILIGVNGDATGGSLKIEGATGAAEFGKATSYDIPSTVTVSANAATVDLSDGDLQVLDLEGSSATVTVTISNPRQGQSWALKIIQGSNGDDITWSPAILTPGGSGLTVTATNDAVDMLTCIYDGSNHICSATQDVQ